MKLYEIGKRVKELRKKEGYTQEEMAKLAGISRVTLGKLERGEIATITLRTLDIVVNALGYEIEFKEKLKNDYGVAVFGE